MAVDVSWEQALAWRMRRQYLVERATDLVAVVERMCGLHAQVMSSVELALAARVDGLTREDVRDALWEQRTLVKLWAMRGTLHVLPSGELSLWLGGLGTLRERFEWMQAPLVEEITDLVGQTLPGRVLTRAELATELTHEIGGWGGEPMLASFQGKLCFGPGDGQRGQVHAPGYLAVRAT